MTPLNRLALLVALVLTLPACAQHDFFVLGAKSYGRNSSFLIRLGVEQVQEVFEYLRA